MQWMCALGGCLGQAHCHACTTKCDGPQTGAQKGKVMRAGGGGGGGKGQTARARPGPTFSGRRILEGQGRGGGDLPSAQCPGDSQGGTIWQGNSLEG